MRDVEHTGYMFRNHSYKKLCGWARALRHFRFCRAVGGHANDGDLFQCSIRFRSEVDLQNVCQRLGLRLVPVLPLKSARSPGSPPGRVEEQRSVIDEFAHYFQPGHVRLFDVLAFVWVSRGVVEIHLGGACGDAYAVSEADFRIAKRLDAAVGLLGLEFCDPPVDADRCVCPKYWPAMFSGA